MNSQIVKVVSGLPLVVLLVAAPVVPAAVTRFAVEVSVAAQKASGFVVRTLAPIHFRPHVSGYGRVLDLAALYALNAKLQSAEAELRAATLEFQRLKRLHREAGNVSARRFEVAQAAWRSDQAQALALRAEAVQRWGRIIAGWMQHPGGSPLMALAMGQVRLLMISIPQATFRFGAPVRLTLPAGGQATLVSRAPFVNRQIQARGYFYLIHVLLPARLQFAVAVPTTTQPLSGVRVPRSAVVWQHGLAWVYLKTGTTRFVRRGLHVRYPDGDSAFVTVGLRPGDQLVVQGAELLLEDESVDAAQHRQRPSTDPRNAP